MGWSELTFDLTDVEDVQEAVEWAEANFNGCFEDEQRAPTGERVYVLYAKVPGADAYLQITGWDPSRAPEWTLRRRHPSGT